MSNGTSRKFSNWRYLLLFLAAVLWGSSFVVQATDKIPPYAFTATRFLLGAILLCGVSFAVDGIKKKKGIYTKPTKTDRKMLWIGGLCCGAIVALAASLQQLGLTLNQEAGKAGFITAMYIVLVPVLGLFIGRRTPWAVWLSVVLGVFGLFLICIKDDSYAINKGDYFLIGCAVAYALHILIVDYFTNRTDGVKLSCLQFVFGGLFTAIVSLIAERDVNMWNVLTDNWMPIVYLAVFSCAGAYTLQIIGQHGTNPAVTSLIMSFESCFALFFGAIILGEKLSLREWLGCMLMFLAIVITKIRDIVVRKYSEKAASGQTQPAGEDAGGEVLADSVSGGESLQDNAPSQPQNKA